MLAGFGLSSTHRGRSHVLPCPIPENEAERQAAVDALALSREPQDPQLEQIVQQAARFLDVPIAFVSLIDSDQMVFVASVGMPAQILPRQISFCGHAILRDGATIVPDARDDERFSANPLVTGPPSVRCYVGMPLTLPGGQSVGALCVVDRQPRRFSADEIELLYALRDAAVDRLIALGTRAKEEFR